MQRNLKRTLAALLLSLALALGGVAAGQLGQPTVVACGPGNCSGGGRGG